MVRKWFVLLAILIFWFGGYAIVGDGRSYCSNGASTYSVGRGACSWHKGQEMQPEKKPILYISIFMLICWACYFFSGEQFSFEEEKPKDAYWSSFSGLSVDVPSEVIIQHLMGSADPMSRVDEICEVFHLNRVKATELVVEAIERKK